MCASSSPQPFDRSLKLLWQHEPEVFFRLLGEAPPLPLEHHPTERLALRQSDAAAWVGADAARHIVHLEFEARPGADLPQRVLLYAALYHCTVEGRPPVRSVVVLLSPPPRGFSRTVRMRTPDGKLRLSFRFEVLRLYAIPAARLAQDPLLAQLTPLGAGFKARRAALLRQAAECIRSAPDGPKIDHLSVLALLGAARGMTTAAINAIITYQEALMSETFRDFVVDYFGPAFERFVHDRAFKEGVQQGVQQGMQQGMQQGLLQGRRLTTRHMLALRYRDATLLDELLPSCGLDDLDWLDEQILGRARPTRLREQLRARLVSAQTPQ